MPVISKNEKKEGIELSFPSRPAEEVLDWIKSRGFSWSKYNQVWWKKFNEDLWRDVHEYFDEPVPEMVVNNENGPLLKPVIERDYTKGLLINSNIEEIPGDQTKPFTFDPVEPIELAIGIEIEKEHTTDLEVAKQITMDHLKENPKYYSEPKPKDWGIKELKEEVKKDNFLKDHIIIAKIPEPDSPIIESEIKTIESDQAAQEVAEQIAEEPIYHTKDNAPANIQDRFGIGKEGYLDKRAGVPKRFIEDLDNGLKLYSVDGKYVRDNLYSDFSQGGNDMAYPEFVPIAEIWYEELMENEKEHIIKHEKDERDLIVGGKTYDQAHEIVKEREDSERGEKETIEPDVKIISEEIITPTQTEEEVAKIPEEQWKEPNIAPKPVMSGIDTINSIDTDNYNYWFERYSTWGKSEVEEVWDKYYKEHAEDPDYLNSSNNRFKALVSVAKKKGIISLIMGKKEKPVSETFESFKADYLANYNALMKYSPNEVGSEIYSEKMAIMSDRHPDWVETIEGESVPKSPEIVPEPVISVTITDYNSDFDRNKAIEKLLDSKWNDGPDKFSEEQLEFIKGYTGYGGLDDEAIKAGEKIDVKALFEYYTPEKVIEKMWGLAYKYGYKDGPVLEPSLGVGSFFDRRFVANTIEKHGYEINKYSAKIAKLLYPEAIINDGAEIKHFEQLFIVKNYTVRSKVTPKYSLVIGNPPYGSVGGQYMGMGESTYTHAKNYIEYFILRGLDLLIPGGLLIYIIGAETAAGGKPFLDQGMTKTKEMIMERGKLIDAYRLPSGVFTRTDVTSDIIVFRRK
jgi:hypothetical protein